MAESRGFLERFLLKALRSVSPRHKAAMDLFELPYSQWVPWNSGLGDALPVLYAMTLAVKPTVIVEIGSARGRSTCAFALGCRRNGFGKVYSIDPHTLNDWTDQGVPSNSENFLRARLSEYQLQDSVEIIKASSTEAAKHWDRPIDLLFVDGDHSYAGVKFDFEAFRSWLTPNALVLFHDTAWNHRQPWEWHPAAKHYGAEMGVPRFMEELRGEGYHSVTLMPEPGLTILWPKSGGFPFLASAAAR